MDLGKANWKPLGRIHHPDATENICDLWKEVKISTLTGVWERDIGSNPHGWFRESKSSVDETTIDVVKIARGLELEMEPEDMPELMQSPDTL